MVTGKGLLFNAITNPNPTLRRGLAGSSPTAQGAAMFFFGTQRFLQSGRAGAEDLISSLDRPFNNFDVAGIPTGGWQSGLCDCHTHCGSCVMSCICPCIAFAQVAVRSQIPFFISLKNGVACLRQTSGYRIFIDCYFWTLALAAACFFCAGYFTVSDYWYKRFLIYFLCFLGIVSAACFIAMNSHLRYAFREKYDLPQVINRDGFGAINKILDHAVGVLCAPCSLSQMMRHLFQYNVWLPRIDFYVGDPSLLDPLVDSGVRHERADLAGLRGEEPDPNARMYSGAGLRVSADSAAVRPHADARLPSSIPIVSSVFAGNNSGATPELDIVYNADGSAVDRQGRRGMN